MFPKLEFAVEDGKVSVKGLPSGLQLKGIKYPSKSLAQLRTLSVASTNIMMAKFYMDAIKTSTNDTDPHMFDAALLAAIVKYGSVFKGDSRGRSIDAEQIFKAKIEIINKSVSDKPMLIDDPHLENLKSHERIIKIRDQVIAHDDRIIGNTACFAAFDAEFNCEKVIALTQRTTIYSAIKAERSRLPMCIDAVFTWLAKEKKRFCELLADEINELDLKVRQKFPEPAFEAYKGLPDAAVRRSQQQPYWDFDWSIGEKRRVGVTKIKRE
jgi:hypothetical protein